MLVRMLSIGLLLAAWALVLERGVRYRISLYERSEPIRFTGDVSNGYYWGTQALEQGLVALYDRIEEQLADVADPDYPLDYPPLRTAAVREWARWTRETFPDAQGWRQDYAFTSPMLWANVVAQGVSVPLIFGLVLHGCRRTVDQPKWWTGIPSANVAALLFWWSPAVLWDAHVFPQWDTWIMPFFLGAVWCASVNRWFVAGVLVAVGALIKGQMLLGAPVLLAWALFSWKPGTALRLLCGIAVATAGVVSPWLIKQVEAIVWVVGVGLSLCAIAWLRNGGREVDPETTGRGARRRELIVWLSTTLVIGAYLAWQAGLLAAAVGGLVFGMFAAGVRLGPRASAPYTLAAALACGVFACGAWFGGSDSWLRIGFLSAANKYDSQMATIGAYNLPAMLRDWYGWSSPQEPVSLPVPWIGWYTIELKTLLVGVYALSLVYCGWAAARWDRARDVRLLLAVVWPFVIAFLLLPQMHSRYLVWGAAFTALGAAVGTGWTLLHVVLSLSCWSMIAYQVLRISPDYWPTMLRGVDGLNPGFTWALLLIGAIGLFGIWPVRNLRGTGPPADQSSFPA